METALVLIGVFIVVPLLVGRFIHIGGGGSGE